MSQSEVIKALIDQCWYSDSEYSPHPQIDHELLADLIIDELNKVLYDNSYSDPHEIPYFIDDVRKHFGGDD